MLDLQADALLKQAAEQGAPDFADLPPVQCRAFFKDFIATVDAPLADVQVTNQSIAGPGGEVALRIFTPKHGPSIKPVLMYFHGGGWVIGGLDEYQGVCSQLAQQSGCVVVSVDYRLAPEHPFPAPVEDCYAALEWVADNAAGLGVDASRLAVCGDSAGGNLATVMALFSRENEGPKIAYQALLYPATAVEDGRFDSYLENAEGYFLTKRTMKYFVDHYQPDLSDYRAAPLNAEDLSGLPPALVIVAGYDPLRDEGKAYAQRMMQAGVPVVLTEYAGMIHGFFSMSAVLDASRQAVSQVATAVRSALAV